MLKIDPMEAMSVPAIVAASPTSPRYFSSSWPGATPAATADAAVVAASSMPNAVPFTATRALSMIFAVSEAEFPRPVSLASAFSIAERRPKPFTSAVPSTAPMPAAPTFTPVLRPVFSPAEICDDMVVLICDPTAVAAGRAVADSWRFRPRMEGTTGI